MFDTGCTHQITTRAVVDGMNTTIEPLDEVRNYSGIWIITKDIRNPPHEHRSRRSRQAKQVECALIEGDAFETLISLNLLKKWNMIQQSFSHENKSNFVDRQKQNKNIQAYFSSFYEMQVQMYQESTPVSIIFSRTFR